MEEADGFFVLMHNLCAERPYACQVESPIPSGFGVATKIRRSRIHMTGSGMFTRLEP